MYRGMQSNVPRNYCLKIINENFFIIMKIAPIVSGRNVMTQAFNTRKSRFE